MVPDRQQDVAAWLIRSRYHKASWSICTLADFATASLEEDRYGILQLTEPGLGTIVQAILSLQLVLQRHLRSTASTGSRRNARHTETGAAFITHCHTWLCGEQIYWTCIFVSQHQMLQSSKFSHGSPVRLPNELPRQPDIGQENKSFSLAGDWTRVSWVKVKWLSH